MSVGCSTPRKIRLSVREELAVVVAGRELLVVAVVEVLMLGRLGGGENQIKEEHKNLERY